MLLMKVVEMRGKFFWRDVSVTIRVNFRKLLQDLVLADFAILVGVQR